MGGALRPPIHLSHHNPLKVISNQKGLNQKGLWGHTFVCLPYLLSNNLNKRYLFIKYAMQESSGLEEKQLIHLHSLSFYDRSQIGLWQTCIMQWNICMLYNLYVAFNSWMAVKNYPSLQLSNCSRIWRFYYYKLKSSSKEISGLKQMLAPLACEKNVVA